MAKKLGAGQTSIKRKGKETCVKQCVKQKTEQRARWSLKKKKRKIEKKKRRRR
jgi:hypothetical protein